MRLTRRTGRDGFDRSCTDRTAERRCSSEWRPPPVEGAANAALIAFLALKMRQSDIRIVSGETSRLKRLFCRGMCMRSQGGRKL